MTRSLFSLPLSVESPILALSALALAVAIIAVRALRTRRSPPATRRRELAIDSLAAIGVGLLMLAAASPSWLSIDRPRIVAFVDVSPSTRGAAYRDPAVLRERLRSLLGRDDLSIVCFADGTLAEPIDASVNAPLGDVPADRTRLALPRSAERDFDAAILFTDGRLEFDRAGSTAKVIAVVDPQLVDPPDGQIASLQRIGDRVVADLRASGPRTLTIDGEAIALSSSRRVERTTTGEVTAALNAADRWPENDAMTLAAPASRATERWWIGDGAPAGWIPHASLPADVGRASAIVLYNVSADAVDATRIAAYVRDFGGGLVIVGGDRSLGSGGYIGTPLDAISPLASSPPTPRRRWVYLVDASGSMSAPAIDGRSRLAVALDAVGQSAARLPDADQHDLATFASSITWQARGRSANSDWTAPDVAASGATNLRAALEAVAATADANAPDALPTELVLLTDGQAELGDVDSLRDTLAAKRINVRLLSFAPLPANAPLRAIATTADAADRPADWQRELTALVGKTASTPVETTPVDVSPWGVRTTAWNRTWLRDRAMAIGSARTSTGDQPMAATWNVGLGRVTTVAFAAPREVVESLGRDVAATPRDPLVDVEWQRDRVRISARTADGKPSNARLFTLDRAGVATQFLQTAPGEYEARLDRVPRPTTAKLMESGRLVDVTSLPGDFPAEFDRVGTDLAALVRTADRVVMPGEQPVLSFSARESRAPLTVPIALAGTTSLALALVTRLRGRS